MCTNQTPPETVPNTHTLSLHPPLDPVCGKVPTMPDHVINCLGEYFMIGLLFYPPRAGAHTHKQPCVLCQPCAVSSTSHRAHSPVHLHTDRTTSSGLEQERDSGFSGWPHGGPSSGAEAAGAESAAVPGPCSGVYVHYSNYNIRTCTTAPTLKHCRYSHNKRCDCHNKQIGHLNFECNIFCKPSKL